VTAAAVLTQITDNTCQITAAPNALKRRNRVEASNDKKGIPVGLAKFAKAELSSACSCLSLKPKATITTIETAAAVVSACGKRYVHYGLINLQTATVTPVVTSTICTGCIPDDSPCNIERPDQCCGQTCYCPSYPQCHCISF